MLACPLSGSLRGSPIWLGYNLLRRLGAAAYSRPASATLALGSFFDWPSRLPFGGLACGQDAHRRVVAVQPHGGHRRSCKVLLLINGGK
jgi:hypothetical protein